MIIDTEVYKEMRETLDDVNNTLIETVIYLKDNLVFPDEVINVLSKKQHIVNDVCQKAGTVDTGKNWVGWEEETPF